MGVGKSVGVGKKRKRYKGGMAIGGLTIECRFRPSAHYMVKKF